MKTIIGVVVVLLVAVGLAGLGLGWWGDLSNERSAEGETVELRGTVTDIDTDQIAFDGPFVVRFEDESGVEHTVHIPSMGLPLCAARESIVAVDMLSIGAEIEVKGTVDSEEVIVPCESADHYLRALNNNGLVACTLEALICPDGSGVGRAGPQCRFEACPNQPSWTGTLLETSEGFFLVFENEGPTGGTYRLPLDVRVSNAIADLVGEEVVVYGVFEMGNTLQVETIELIQQ